MSFAHFTRIRVGRAPGIPAGEGWECADLSPGFNLIHGPNGSGKTTTGRAVQELLWPGSVFAGERPTISGELTVNGVVERIEIEAGHVVGARPQLGTAERRRRYWLAFDDLIRENDTQFARSVIEEMQGGYDLAGAAASLEYSPQPTEPRGVASDLRQAQQKVVDAENRQRQVEEHATRIGQVKRDRASAAAAGREATMLERALEHQRVAAECRGFEVEIASLPAGVAKLYGNEQEALDELNEQERRCRQELEKSRLEAVRAERELTAAGLGEGLPAEVLPRLRGLVSELRQAQVEMERSRERLAAAEAVEKSTRQRLGERLEGSDQGASRSTSGATPAIAGLADRVELPEVMSLARQADELRAREQTLTQRRRWLEQEASGAGSNVPPPESLQEAIGALSRWLAASGAVEAGRAIAPNGAVRGSPGTVAFTAGGAGLVMVVAAVLAVVHHWAWLGVVAIVAAGAAVVLTMLARPHVGVQAGAAADERAVHRREFERTSLQPPASWEVEPASRRLAELSQQLAQVELARECVRRLEEQVHEERDLETQRAQLRARRDALEARLGVSLQLDDDAWLPVLVESLASWQRAVEVIAAGRAELRRQEERRDELLAGAMEVLSGQGFVRPGSAGELEHLLQDLADRQQRHAQARHDLASAREREGRARDELEANRRDRDKLLGRLGLADEQAGLIADWLAERPRLQDLQRSLTSRAGIRDRLAQELADHGDLLEMDVHALEERLAEASQQAGRLDELQQEIAALEHEIAHAKRAHDLTDALAVRDGVKATLQDERERCRRSVVGSALTDWLRTHSSASERPQVLRRANELLVKVTAGALRLDVKGGVGDCPASGRGDAEPAFVAVIDGQERELPQLSLGERTQVLMAVRLAFMERDESVALPLILDEVLANADDRRAGMLIDVLLDFVCAEGEVCRQVFCFTAQHDEAGKWLGRLETRRERGRAPVPYREIDLAELRRHVEATEAVSILAPAPRQVPEPAEATWSEYGRRLKVPRVQPALGADGQHVWHMVHDSQAVHSLLTLGVRRWGQLRTMLEHADGDLPQLNGHVERARAAAEVIEALCEAWSHGRGRPLDKGVLEQAEAVTSAFLDRVCELAMSHGWDARKLLGALAAGELQRWRQENTPRLEQFLRDEGHLPEEEPLAREELEARVAAVASRHVHEGRLPAGWVEELLASIRTDGDAA